ncbi:response regulator [Jiella sp. M17.18]|uniref:response regulator n=1 Tax=Jiella sp. M17.18 TaxID=3234247 RepID=UPI0034DE507F
MNRGGQAPSLEGRRMLVVEDEYMLADDMALDFKCFGAEISGPVPTIAEARALLDDDGPIDGAVLDINLNGEMVYEFADLLNERGIPFLFATGYDRHSLPGRFKGTLVCEKPVDAAQLAAGLFA